MNAVLLPGGTIAVLDAHKQRAAVAALEGAVWSAGLKGYVVAATPGNAASLAALCPTLPADIRAMLPAIEQRVVHDSDTWLTYDPALYDPALVWVDEDGDTHDDNRDRAKAPWEHQRDAVGTIQDLLQRGRGSAALMEQRTGKARISIELWARFARADRVHRVLITSLSTPCGDYAEQVAEYLAGSVPVALLTGLTPKKRTQALEALSGPLQVAIVNYESAWRMEDELLEWAPEFVVADEMHKIKTPPTKQRGRASAFMHKLADRVPYRLGMTGTATPRSPLDIWSEYRFCDRSVFGDSYFVTKAVYGVETPIIGAGGVPKTYTRTLRDGTVVTKDVKTVTGYVRLDELQEKMHSIAFVRRMEECRDLPPTAHLEVPVTLGPKAARAYRELAKDSVVEWDRGETSADNVLTRKLRLQQITSGMVPRDDGQLEIVGTEKLDAFMDTASGILDGGQKIVAYARFTHEVESAVEKLKAAGYGTVEISGRIPIGPKRDAARAAFQKDPDVLAMVCQIQAGGVGIDLSAASTEIFISKSHTFGDYDQARSRIVHGSKSKPLTYYHLVCHGTVDDEIEESRRLKCDLSLLLLNRKGNPFQGGAL